MQVAVSRGVAIVGARAADIGLQNSGAAYVFDTNTGTLLHTLPNPTPAFFDLFGACVAAGSGVVVVGTPNDDHLAPGNSGSVYVFGANTGDLLHTLRSPTPASSDRFGESVTVGNGLIVVGTPGDDTQAFDAGALHVFDVDTGVLLHTLFSPAPVQGTALGKSVALFGTTVVAGKPSNPAKGTALVFHLDFDCNTNGVPDECDIAGGSSVDANGNGVPDECEP